MIKSHPIVKGTAATLLAVFGLIMIVWGHARPAPATARSAKDTVRAVRLRLNFEGGHWANVTEFEGGAIKIEKDGKKLAITPYIRDQGKVELRVFQAVQHEGRETMEAAGTLLVDKGLTKLEQGGLLSSVQVLDAEKRLPSELLAAPAAECCTRTCSGVLVCGVCVCTDCGVCFTHGWCDCPPPAPPGE
ncbi:MAG TPA: hypothetical protein VHU19_15020 [Pyrinomonadaceae bacterium]|jgi:hypothetical protein|nr:hypothetical protein [Pyrinomonadaceae bacterium]